MIVRFNPRPEDLQHLQVGPLGPHLPSFATLGPLALPWIGGAQ